MKLRTIPEQLAIEERLKTNRYLDDYDIFVTECNRRPTTEDLSSMELAILHHGYVTGGK
jgi:hypothetical protein